MPIDELLEILRQVDDSKAAWDSQLKLLQLTFHSDLWNNLPEVDIRRDVDVATAWLQTCLEQVKSPAGIYLGLDTLNMDGGHGHNLEVGWINKVDVEDDDTDWIYRGLQYGPRHLLGGLVDIHSTYSRPEWEDQFSNADYMLFLGYSGLILREVLKNAAIPEPALVAWGFHDGDMFLLGRKKAGVFEILGT